MTNEASRDILDRVKSALRTAELGLQDVLVGTPDRRFVGLRNVVVFGRSVTNILQNLRSKEPSFDEWYKRYEEEMRDDELMKYIYKLRSSILKEGLLNTSTSLHIKSFNTNDMNRFPRPPGATGFFMGDAYGGSGWIVPMPDGTEEKYYISLPEDIGSTKVKFQNAPKLHLGKEIANDTIQGICTLYVNYLKSMVNDAYSKFGSRQT